MRKGFDVAILMILASLPLQMTGCDRGWAQTIANRKTEADRLNQLGSQQLERGQFQEALQTFQRVLSLRKEGKDLIGEGTTLNNICDAYSSLGQYVKAEESCQQALVLGKQTKDRRIEETSLNGIGDTYFYRGKFAKSLEYYQQALKIGQEISDRVLQGIILSNIGEAYSNLGQFARSLEYYEQALKIKIALGDRTGKGILLNNIGIVYRNLGQYSKALEYYQQSLKIKTEIGDRAGEAATLNNIALVYDNLGQYVKALEYYQQVLTLIKEVGEHSKEGRTLNNIGEVYDNLGQYSKALEYYQLALKVEKEERDRLVEGTTLNNIGAAYISLGEYAKALEYYQLALKIKKEVGDRFGEANTINNIGFAYRNLKQYSKALEYFQQALKLEKEIGHRFGEAATLRNIGLIYYSLEQYPKALEHYQQALAIVREIGDRAGEARSLSHIGNVLNALTQRELAIQVFKQSVNVSELIRKDLKKLSREEQLSFTRTVVETYRALADLLLKQGRVTEALQVLDLLKVQELEDYLKNLKGNDRTAQGVRFLEPEKVHSRQWTVESFEKIPELNRQLANQIQQIPQAEINRVPEYLQKIPQGTVLLYPLILSDRLEIILFSPNTFPIHRAVPIKKADLAKLVDDFRADLRDPSSQDVKDSSKKLYDLLVKPIEAELEHSKAKTILYAPDAQLRYIPVAALYDGKQWLIEKYRVSNLIAYSLTDFDLKPQNSPNILAGAYGKGDPRLKQTPLPATIAEVSEIAKTFPNTVNLVETEFSRAAIEAQISNHNILHLATHAEFNLGKPDNSFILFGNGDTVRLSEIADWKMGNIDLIVLSACQTGVGKLGDGVEILGFGYQVQRAGAKAAIASLWSVSDGGTQSFMDGFYHNLKRGDVSVSTALREAQLQMIRQPVKQGEISFNHPYYWSAFVLIGNGL